MNQSAENIFTNKKNPEENLFENFRKGNTIFVQMFKHFQHNNYLLIFLPEVACTAKGVT